MNGRGADLWVHWFHAATHHGFPATPTGCHTTFVLRPPSCRCSPAVVLVTALLVLRSRLCWFVSASFAFTFGRLLGSFRFCVRFIVFLLLLLRFTAHRSGLSRYVIASSACVDSFAALVPPAAVLLCVLRLFSPLFVCRSGFSCFVATERSAWNYLPPVTPLCTTRAIAVCLFSFLHISSPNVPNCRFLPFSSFCAVFLYGRWLFGVPLVIRC